MCEKENKFMKCINYNDSYIIKFPTENSDAISVKYGILYAQIALRRRQVIVVMVY